MRFVFILLLIGSLFSRSNNQAMISSIKTEFSTSEHLIKEKVSLKDIKTNLIGKYSKLSISTKNLLIDLDGFTQDNFIFTISVIFSVFAYFFNIFIEAYIRLYMII